MLAVCFFLAAVFWQMILFQTLRRDVLKVEAEITPETPTVHLTATRC